MAKEPDIRLSVEPSATEEWVLDGGVNVSRRFDINAVGRRPFKLLPRDVAANPADDRKPI
ncbi:hypothetical protein D3C71_1907330 [compost metagenome]